MNKIIYILIILCLVVSIGLNIIFLCGGGINIDNRVTNHQEQFQQQWQGQLLINQWAAQGNQIEWKILHFRSGDFTIVQKELNKLHPISALYAKVIYEYNRISGEDIKIIYPDIFSKTLEKEIKK